MVVERDEQPNQSLFKKLKYLSVQLIFFYPIDQAKLNILQQSISKRPITQESSLYRTSREKLARRLEEAQDKNVKKIQLDTL